MNYYGIKIYVVANGLLNTYTISDFDPKNRVYLLTADDADVLEVSEAQIDLLMKDVLDERLP